MGRGSGHNNFQPREDFIPKSYTRVRLKKKKTIIENHDIYGRLYSQSNSEPIKTVYVKGKLVKATYQLPNGDLLNKKWYKNGKLKEETYFHNNILHRIDGPAVRRWYKNGKLKEENFFYFGKLISSLSQHWDKTN